jgi:DNA-binding NarL/FixJ family response regulator
MPVLRTKAKTQTPAAQSGEATLIRVLVVDDHPVVRKGIRSYLARVQDLQVVAEAQDGLEAISKAREFSPDVVLMDVDMPNLDGLSATRILHQENPRIKVLVISVHPSARFFQRLLESGACGYLSKKTPMTELIRAIYALAAGRTFN